MTTAADPTHDREQLVADARALATTLEAAHPDPYAGHGGRVAFHWRLAQLTRAVPDDGEPLGRFRRRLQSFVAAIGDGHTAVLSPEREPSREGRLPLSCRVVGEGLHVSAVYDDSLAPLLGGRLRSVAGESVATLRERHAELSSADNRYGALKNLAATLGSDLDALARLLDTDDVAPTLVVECPDGRTIEREMTPTAATDPTDRLDDSLDHPESAGEPAYRVLDDGATALLRLPDSTAYREHHEAAAAVDRGGGSLTDARETYRRVVGDPVPEDPEAVVAGLPAASDELGALAETMAEAGTDTLVVDTRGNSGGSSILAYLLVYVLHGWSGVRTAVGDQWAAGKHSELYREQFGDAGPLADPETTDGFDLDDCFVDPERQVDQVREQLTGLSDTLAEWFRSGEYAGYYRPEQVVVVTDARTFSAGVEPGILLSKLGADVVGVPSGQSPNGPRDVLVDDLPNTGLRFSVSFRHHVFLPGETGEVFELDVELTPGRFRAFDAAADAGVRLALAHAAGEVPPADSWP